jgi:cell division protein FtsQ
MNRQYKLVNRGLKEKAPFPSFSFILIMFFFMLLGYGFYQFSFYMINESKMFMLKNIEVKGSKYIKAKEIIKLASIEPDIKLFKVPLQSTAQKILKYPYFEGVSVSRVLPSTIIISVQEREPVAFLVDGNVYMVDYIGKILLKKPGMSLEKLPLITGLSVNQLLKNRQPLLNALHLIDEIKAVDKDLFQFISEVHIRKAEPPQLYLIRGGACVEIGDEQIKKRVLHLRELLKKPSILNDLDEIKNIDLTFNNRIIVTRKS